MSTLVIKDWCHSYIQQLCVDSDYITSVLSVDVIFSVTNIVMTLTSPHSS